MEGRVFRGQRGDAVLGKAELQQARLLVEHGAGDQLREDLVVEAERRRLFARQALAELLRQRR